MVNHGPYAAFATGKDAVDGAAKTGTGAIVVGAGIGGLVCAVELMLNGVAPVTVFDQVPVFARLGDTIGIMPNAGRIIGRWPGLFEVLDPLCGHARGIKILRWDGKHIVDQMTPTPTDEAGWEAERAARRESPDFDAHRGDLHQTLLDYAIAAGVQVRQGVSVSAYTETEYDASVIIDGQKVTADFIIGADGVKSKAREIVLGYVDATKSSGYAIYRAFFNGDIIRSNPITAHLVTDHKDQRSVFIGPDVHFICAGIKDTKEFSWVMTHLDEADVSESWTMPGKVEDALKVAAAFDPVVRAVISSTPPGHLLDWKLVYRDPLPTWVSPKGRIALLGDAAHPFLPTSIQGASQAMEDGTTIAQVIRIAGKSGVPTALRAYQDIRYERVKTTQKMGKEWHKPRDWDNIEPESVMLPRHPALFGHDAAAHAIAEFPAAAARVNAKLAAFAPSPAKHVVDAAPVAVTA